MIEHEAQAIAPVAKRLIAKMIDIAIVIFLGLALQGGAGSVIGFIYSVLADAISFKHVQGQSVGKKVMGLRVYHSPAKHPRFARIKISATRNAPVGFVTFLMIVPFWGWILSLLLGIPLFLIELSLMIRADRRQRLGDVMAETVVVEV